MKIRVISINMLVVISTLLISQTQAQASASGCPDTWNLSASKFPIGDSDDLYTAQSTFGRTLTFQLMNVAYTFDGKHFSTVELGQRVPNILDATPVALAVDRSFSLLLSGKPLKVTYSFRMSGCSSIKSFTIPSSFQKVTTSKTSFTAYLSTVKSYTDGFDPVGLPEEALFKNPKSIASAQNDIANCQKNLVKAAATSSGQGSTLSQRFLDACSMAGGKFNEVRVFQETPNCLVRQAAAGTANAYAVKQGSTCKVALARVLGDDPNTTKLLGPKAAYIFSEFNLVGKFAVAKKKK